MTKSNNYHFISKWTIDAPPELIYRILENAEDLTRWWPEVYLDVLIVEQGDQNGIGKLVDLFTKGYLPYRLNWSFKVTEAIFPTSMSIEAYGDFVGRGKWTFHALEKNKTLVIYDWSIVAEKPLLKYLSWLCKPLFKSNHEWAMRKGEINLKKEIANKLCNVANVNQIQSVGINY